MSHGLTDSSAGHFVLVVDSGARWVDEDVSANGEHSAGGTLGAARREALTWLSDTIGGSIRIAVVLLDGELATVEVLR